MADILNMSPRKKASVTGDMKCKHVNILILEKVELLRKVDCSGLVRELCNAYGTSTVHDIVIARGVGEQVLVV